jgi:hypothetical protein
MFMVPVILFVLAQAAEPEGVILTGTVVGMDGKPAVGAEVVLAEGTPPVMNIVRLTGAVLKPAAVLRTQRADSAGQFQVVLSQDDATIQRFRRPMFLWAFGPGGALAMRPIPHDWPPDGVPVRLALAPSEAVRVRVLDPEERPVAGARLVPARIRGVEIPTDLGGRFAVETDAQGQAALAAGATDELEVIRVTSGPFGVQQLRTPRPEAEGVRTLQLMPVGRIAGQVQAGDLQAVRGLAVRIRTVSDPSAEVAGVGGWASVVTDDQGRFTVPAIAAGMPAMSVDLRWDLPWRGLPSRRPPVQPGTTTEVTIPLKPAALVKGVVQEIPNGRPIAGVGVAVVMDEETPLARSDAQGRYSAYIAPGMARSYAVGMPRGYYSPSSRANSQPLPDGVKELTMKPLGLNRGVEVRGQVVDAEGKPVPGADVAGHYDLISGLGRRIHAVADREGRFRLDSIPPDTTLYLSAVRGGATTAAPESILPSKPSIMLGISPEHAVALYGRVKDPADRPVAGAVVRVQARKRGSQDILLEQLTISFDDEGRTTLRTGADGQFHTPRQLRPDLEYRVEVEADDYVPAGTEWIKPGDRKLLYFPALVLQPMARTRMVAGRVVDVQGRPVAGAVVFQSGDGPARSRTTTDADGRFRLPGVYREPAFLFVEGDGLAFAGHRIGTGAEPVEVKIRRVGDPPGPPLHTLPSVMPREQEKALARRLIESDLSPLTGKEVTTETLVLIRTLPRVDLERALELADNKAVPDPDYNEQLRLECARGLIDGNLEEAATIAETLKLAHLRSQFYREASDALPKTDHARRVDLLNKALLHARAETDPLRKLDELGMIGYRLLDLGETERGTQVLREGERLADTLPKFVAGQRNSSIAHARGRFAAKLARIDAPAALKLAEGYSNPYDEWYVGGVALGLSDRDPAGSERAFGMLKNKGLRDLKVIRAAGRMAAIDRERARRLAEALEQPIQQVLALGSMARGLVVPDPKAAAALIDEAIGRLVKVVEKGGERPSGEAALAAAELLPAAERIDPELLRRCFWRTVALRPPRPAGGDPTGLYEQGAASLAITLARYDRAVAHQVLEPAARRARSLDYSRRSRPHNVFAAAAVIDPAWAVALADSLPDDTPGANLHPKAMMRRVIADVLAHGGSERWDQFHNPQAGFYLSSRHRDSKDDER